MDGPFDEPAFRRNVERSLAAARSVLDVEKHGRLRVEGLGHAWLDKFGQADVLANTALSAVLAVLEVVGMNARALRQAREWVREGRSCTLRLKAEERCDFVREEKREEDSKTKHVTTWTAASGAPLGQRTDKTVTTITEYFWAFQVDYTVSVFGGNAPDDGVVLQSRTGRHEIKTSGRATPRPVALVRPSIDCNLTWLLARLDGAGRMAFAINRAGPRTHTPVNNAEVEEAVTALSEWKRWCDAAASYLRNDLFSAQAGHALDVTALNDDAVFMPVVPLLEQREAETAVAAARGGPLLADTVDALLAEHRRTLGAKCAELGRVFPDGGGGVVTAAEAVLVVACVAGAHVTRAFAEGMQSIEEFLRQQLVRAIGREVSTLDFAKYMVFHGRQLFRPEYQPRPFCYAVRRPGHVPEGEVALESVPQDGSSAGEPIFTLVARASVSAVERPFQFALHDAATVSFGGEVLTHAWLDHVFSGSSGARLVLSARARQFSSYVVLVGRLAGARLFEPAFGLLVQNKDEVRIPLDAELIPSAGEFRDAVESLSDEQRAFAQAYRGMQLASTLFAVCVVQVKPQLEKLLRLPEDGLTKEIRLTQDLLQLFVRYQVPSDLLSYAGEAAAPDAAKVDEVKGHVAAMQRMVDDAKRTQISEARQEQTIAVLDSIVAVPDLSKKKDKGRKVRKDTKKKKSKPMKKMADESKGGGGFLGGNDNNAPVATAAAPPTADAPPPPPEPSEQSKAVVERGKGGEASSAALDATQLPGLLDQRLEALDVDGAVHATVLSVGATWQKSSLSGLLATAPSVTALGASQQRLEKQQCWDLLDALSKSGALAVDHASLHIVVASSHVFDRSVMDTLVKDNVNPIERVQSSQLIIASTLHNTPVPLLLKDPAAVAQVTSREVMALNAAAAPQLQ